MREFLPVLSRPKLWLVHRQSEFLAHKLEPLQSSLAGAYPQRVREDTAEGAALVQSIARLSTKLVPYLEHLVGYTVCAQARSHRAAFGWF